MAERPPPGSGVAENLLRASLPAWGPQEEARIRSALKRIPADIDGRTWVSFGYALYDLRWIINGQDIGLEIWDDWSKTSTGKGPGSGEYRGRDDLEKRWQSFARDYTGPRVTIGSIFHKAKENGWTDDDFHTDLGNARRFVRRHGENIRFIPEWQKWITW
jgi:hypothetical protein